MKRSMDLRRQGVIWELGLLLQQNEAEEAALIEKAKAAHRQGILNVKVSCTKVVLEAKSTYRAAVQEAKRLGAKNSRSWRWPIVRPLVRPLLRDPLGPRHSM